MVEIRQLFLRLLDCSKQQPYLEYRYDNSVRSGKHSLIF